MLDEMTMLATTPIEHQDNLPIREDERQQPERRTFCLPGWIWKAMMASYGIFFLGLALATAHDRESSMTIVIAVLFAVIYFGAATVLRAMHGPDVKDPDDRGLDTLYGRIGWNAVAAQILTVPAVMALFGSAVALIVAL